MGHKHSMLSIDFEEACYDIYKILEVGNFLGYEILLMQGSGPKEWIAQGAEK